MAQVKFEPHLRILGATASSLADIKDATIIDLDEVPNLSFALLPCDGSGRSWIKNQHRVKEVLIREARVSDVWHTTISLRVWDLTHMSYEVGRQHAPGLRVFVMDGDAVSMLRGSGRLSRLKSYLVQRQLIHRLQDADMSIFVGQGIHDTYAKYAKQSVMTNAVWLTNGEIADPAEVSQRFQDLRTPRLVLPTRLTAWKGVDDAIRAVGILGDQLGPFHLDIVGEGDVKQDLIKLVKREGLENRIQFLPSVAYGEPFFRFLRNYHMVLAPTRALEETRIVYDAAANGCASSIRPPRPWRMLCKGFRRDGATSRTTRDRWPTRLPPRSPSATAGMRRVWRVWSS